MTIEGQIINSVTGEGIDGASITVMDGNGRYLGQGIAAGTGGNFKFTSNLIDGNNLAFSAAGYLTNTINAVSFPINVPVEVPLTVNSLLPEVIVTPPKKKPSLLPLLGAALVFGFIVVLTNEKHNGK